MMQFEWNVLPHTLVMVTAGGPRSCCESMKEAIDTRRWEMGDSVRLYRLVKGDDVVVALPSSELGFTHLVPKVLIGKNGSITREEEYLCSYGDERDSVTEDISRSSLLEEISHMQSFGSKPRELYAQLVNEIPLELHDHMPNA